MIRLLSPRPLTVVNPNRRKSVAAANDGEARNCISLDWQPSAAPSASARSNSRWSAGRPTATSSAAVARACAMPAAVSRPAFDVYGSQLCRGDLVRVLDPNSALGIGGEYRSAIPCPLGNFVPCLKSRTRRRTRTASVGLNAARA
jgi:hypothetical protein